MGRKKQKYVFDRQIEILVAYAEATSRKFHEAIGFAIDQDRMPSEDAQLIVGVAHQIAAESGTPCTDTKYIIQRLRLQNEDGKVTDEQILDVFELLESASECPIDDMDLFIKEIVPVIKRVKEKDVLEKALKDYSRGLNSDRLAEDFAKVANLGKRRETHGSFMTGTEEEFEDLFDTKLNDPLSTSVPEIDLEVDGGLERGSLGVVLAGSGDGKSYFLCSIAAEAVLHGKNVLYVTLELTERVVKSRIYRNLLDMTETEMREDKKLCAERMKLLRENGLGYVRVQYESPGVTTPDDIKNRLKEIEQEHNIKCEVLLVDYADKLISGGRGTRDNKYSEMEKVYDPLRDIAVQSNGWTWTASQTTRGAVGTKNITQGHVADSMHKIRSADLVVGVIRSEEDKEKGLVNFSFPKRRHGEAPSKVGPLMVSWDKGRMTDVLRVYPWDTGFTTLGKSESANEVIQAILKGTQK